MVPVRFGLVPAGKKRSAIEQATVVYYLQDAYGLAAVMEYLELVSSHPAPSVTLSDRARSLSTIAHLTHRLKHTLALHRLLARCEGSRWR